MVITLVEVLSKTVTDRNLHRGVKPNGLIHATTYGMLHTTI